jgi:large subunit ribosomal protein L7/L12
VQWVIFIFFNNLAVSSPKAGGSEGKEGKAKAQEEKKVVEKSIFDIKLASFDAAKKIALIKEVRAWLNLGLKEAKELVEKAPCELKKGVKKEEAEEIKKKLADNGANIEFI